MRLLLSWSICLFIYLMITLPAWSQAPRMPMKYLNTEHGIADDHCWTMIQDQLGYIWIGTNKGLSRYDGYEFVNYHSIEGDPLSLQGDSIHFILENQEGNLWLGSEQGLHFFDRALQTFRLIRLEETVHFILEDQRGGIWAVSGMKNHLYRWDPASETLTAMHVESGNRPLIQVGKPHLVFDRAPILEDQSGNIWVGTMGDGLASFDQQKETFVPVPGVKGDLPGDSIFSLLLDPNQILWLGTAKGLIRFDLDRQSVIPFSKGDPAAGKAVYDLQLDPGGKLWVHQAFDLIQLDPQNDEILTHFQLPEIGLGTENGPFRKRFFTWIGADEEENIYWVNPMNHHQVFVFEAQPKQMMAFTHEFPEKNRRWSYNAVRIALSGLLDHTGLLWLAWKGGVLHTQEKGQVFHSYTTNDNNDFNTLFLEDEQGRIWFMGQHLSLFSPQTKEYIEVSKFFPELDEDLPYFLKSDRQHNIWWGSISGLNKLELEKHENAFVNLALGKSIKASSTQATPMHLPEFAVDGDPNTRWASEYSNPQWLELDLGTVEEIDQLVLHWEEAAALHYQILLSADGQRWQQVYATKKGKGGVEKISIGQKGRFLKILLTQQTIPYGYSIWEIQVLSNTPRLKKFQAIPDNPQSLPHSQTLSMHVDEKGQIWVGTVGGMSLYRPGTDDFISFEIPDLDPDVPAVVLDIFDDREGSLYLLDGDLNPIEGRRYWIFDKSNFYIEAFLPPLDDTLKRTRFNYILRDAAGSLWLSSDNGIFKYDARARQIQQHIGGVKIRAVYENEAGIFWLINPQGQLYQLNPENEEIQAFDLRRKIPLISIQSDQVFSFGGWSTGVLVEDRAKKLWIITNKGLVRFDPTTDQLDLFGKKDGLISDQPSSIFQDSRGRIYVGAAEGFSCFDPAEVKPNPSRPNMVISDFKIAYQTVKPGGEDAPLSRHISQTEAVSLAHDQNVISLGFTAIHHQNPEANRYQVMLEGLDTAWVNLGTQRSMNYAGLSPGEYMFKVKGSNADGVWSETAASLKITIHPPWWRTLLAYAIYIVLLLAAIYAFIQWRTNSLRRQRQLLRKRVFEQTQELREAKETAEEAKQAAESANEAKSTFLSTVSHELRTPLTSIIGFTKLNQKNLTDKVLPVIPGDDPKAQKAAQRISKNLDVVSSEGERLTALINELLDLAKIESGKMEWKREAFRAAALIERAQNATAALFTQKPSLQLITAVPNDLPQITGDPDRLLQVLINLISNAVKFTEEGEVRIGVVHSPQSKVDSELSLHQNYGLPTTDSLTFSVQDSGSGIPADQHDKVFERFQQVEDNQAGKPKGTGLGLPICKQIVEHHGGRIWVESDVGKGSVFFFTLKIKA